MVEDTRDTYGIKYIRKTEEKKDEPAKADANTRYYLNTGAGGVGGRGKQVSQQTYHNVEHLGGDTMRVGDDDISTDGQIVSQIDRNQSSINPKKIGKKDEVKTKLGTSGRGGARAGTGGGQNKVQQAKEQGLTVSPAPKVDDDEGGDKAKSLAETVYYNNLIIKGMDSVSARLKTINFFLDKARPNTWDKKIKVRRIDENGRLAVDEKGKPLYDEIDNVNYGKDSIESKEGTVRGDAKTLDRNASQEHLRAHNYIKEQAKENEKTGGGQTLSEIASELGKDVPVTPPKAKDEVTGQKPKQSEAGRGSHSVTNNFGIGAGGKIGGGKAGDGRRYGGDSTGKSRYAKNRLTTNNNNSNNDSA